MKFSVFTVMTPDLTPAQLTEALKESGYEGVEWRFKEIPDEAKNEQPSYWRNNLCSIDPQATDEQIKAFLEAADRNGITAVSVTPYLSCGDLEGTERVMQVAKALGAGQIRVGVPRYDRSENYNDLYKQAVDYLHGVQELSRKYGVKGLVETHHMTITPSASLAHRVVSGFDPDCIGVLFDPGNMVHEGYENYRMGLELLGPYLAHVHIKNASWQKAGEREDGTAEWRAGWSQVMGGVVDWKQVLADLVAVGYNGYLGFEDFSGAKPSVDLLKENAGYIRSLLDQI